MASNRAPARPEPPSLIGGGTGAALYGPFLNGSPQNRKPDGRLFDATPWVGKIDRGEIMEYDAGTNRYGPGRVQFMYNPNEITYTFQFNSAIADPSQTAQIPTLGALGGTVLGFTLFFDRHYEVAYGGDKQGVLDDLRVLKYIVGMKSDAYNFMITKTNRFILGTNHRFFGIINSMQARLAHFSEQMVPMVAEVMISAIQVPANWNPQTGETEPKEEEKKPDQSASRGPDYYKMPSNSEANKSGESISQWGPAA